MQPVQHIFFGDLSDGEKYFAPLVVEALHVVILHWTPNRSWKSRRVSTDLRVAMDHVDSLSSFQESIVLFCLLLFHVDSPLEVSGQQLIEGTRNIFNQVACGLQALRLLRARAHPKATTFPPVLPTEVYGPTRFPQSTFAVPTSTGYARTEQYGTYSALT